MIVKGYFLFHRLKPVLIMLLAIPFLTHSQIIPTVSYTTKDGLVNNRLKYIYQDSRGKMYFATYGGLSVYDGSRFTNYTTDNGLIASLVNNIIELGPDSLLLVPNTQALQLLVRGKIKNLIIRGGPKPVVNEMFPCTNGNLYALADEGLFLYRNGAFSRIDLCRVNGNDYSRNFYHGVQFKNFLLIASDPNSPVFPVPTLVYVYDLATGKSFTNPALPKILCITKAPSGEILAATNSGIKSIDLEKLIHGELILKSPSQKYNLGHHTAVYMYTDSDGNFWMITQGGILRVSPSGERRFIITNANPIINWNFIFQDREKTIWFGNEESGVTKLVYQNMDLEVKLAGGFEPTDVSSYYSGKHTWFFNSYRHKLLLTSKNHIHLFTESGRKDAFWITANDSMVYAGDVYGIYRVDFLSNSEYKLHLLYRDSSNQFGFHSFNFDKYGDLVAISNKITVIFRDHNIITLPLLVLCDQSFVRNDSVWLITRQNELYLFKINPFQSERLLLLRHLNLQLPAASARSMTVDNSGGIWVGTREHGLFYFTLDQQIHLQAHVTMKDGLSDNFILMLFADHNDHIWACSQSALDNIILVGKQLYIESITESSNLFLHAVKLQENSDGLLWVITTSGLCRINNNFKRIQNYTPPLQLVKATINNVDYSAALNNVELTSANNNISLHLAIPSFINEKNIIFFYHLTESGKNVLSKISSLGDIDFYNLSPGHYTLTITASFRNGIYPPQQLHYNFTIQPPWYRLLWVEIIFLVIILLAAGLLIRFYYRSQIEKQKILLDRKEVVERERNRIANDLHDELGSGLTKIAILSEVTKTQLPPSAEKIDHLDKISHTSRELVDNLQDIIWVLNPKYDSLENVLGYIHQYTAEFLEASGKQLDFENPVNIPSHKLSEEQKRNLLLAVKETINNSVKHSGCSRIKFSVHIKGKRLELIISDNGSGFNVNSIRNFSNGLGGMKKRMNNINGDFSIVAGQGGTTTFLSITLSGDIEL